MTANGLIAGNAGQAAQTAPDIDEYVWGNDRFVLDKLTKSQLAERRLFVRIRHFQKVFCGEVCESPDAEPAPAPHSIEFNITDLSAGGIGIVSDSEIDTGVILSFPLMLDGISYKIKCEVVYCIPCGGKFRAGLKLVRGDRQFVTHLKIFIARTSLNSAYGKTAG